MTWHRPGNNRIRPRIPPLRAGGENPLSSTRERKASSRKWAPGGFPIATSTTGLLADPGRPAAVEGSRRLKLETEQTPGPANAIIQTQQLDAGKGRTYGQSGGELKRVPSADGPGGKWKPGSLDGLRADAHQKPVRGGPVESDSKVRDCGFVNNVSCLKVLPKQVSTRGRKPVDYT